MLHNSIILSDNKGYFKFAQEERAIGTLEGARVSLLGFFQYNLRFPVRMDALTTLALFRQRKISLFSFFCFGKTVPFTPQEHLLHYYCSDRKYKPTDGENRTKQKTHRIVLESDFMSSRRNLDSSEQ